MNDTIAPTDHIGDAETVYMTHECTEGVGTSLGKAFREVWAPKGWTQTTREAYEAHQAKLNEEQVAFLASPDAIMVPDGEAEAQDIINGERGGDAPMSLDDDTFDVAADEQTTDAALPHEVATSYDEGGLD